MKTDKPWRVRVKRLIEDWVEVAAPTAQEAERRADFIPGVAFVFASSAIPGDKLAEAVFSQGVEDSKA